MIGFKKGGIAIVLSAIVSVTFAQNSTYCEAKYRDGKVCPDGNHIGCISFWETVTNLCPADVQEVDITPFKDLILKTHNTLRNELAGGNVNGGEVGKYPEAAKMTTVKYNDELAFLALAKAKTCEFEHDKCRKTPLFRWAGQNIAEIPCYGASFTKFENAIKLSMKLWWEEYKILTQKQFDSYYKIE